jgi:hypothetical protein
VRSALLVLALVIAACAPARVPRAECGRTTFVWVDPAFRPNEHEDFRRAEDAWTRATKKQECFREVALDQANLYVWRADTQRELLERRGYAKWSETAGVWFPDRQEIWIVPDRWKDPYITTIGAHELGHYFGLSHRAEPSGSSVVNARLEDDFLVVDGAELPASDVRVYCALNGC